jgi:hypothetical protein
MKSILLAVAISLWSMPALAQARPERLPDKDVKALIDQVDEGRDKFEGNLDGDFKGSTVAGANGPTKVSVALQDYQDNTKKLKDRFASEYAASAEVATVLKQSNSIDRFMQGTGSTMKGRSEWDRQVGNLKRLAAVYGATFPLPEGVTARRINDKEAAGYAEAIANAADRFENDVDKLKALPEPERDAAKKDVEMVEKNANDVKSRINGEQPATTELRLLIDQVAKVQTFAGKNSLSTANWQAVQASLGKLKQAFGLD